MSQDGACDRLRTTIVKEVCAPGDTPQRRSPELAAACRALHESTGQAGAHVTEQQVGEREDRRGASEATQRRLMTLSATDRGENSRSGRVDEGFPGWVLAAKVALS